MVATSELLDAFGAAGYRLTRPRRALAEVIASRDDHFTADELLAESGRRRLGLGRATVFRALDTLTELGVVERLDLPSGDHAFVTCEPTHHHHVVCSSCGRSTPIGDDGVANLAAKVEASTGYRVDMHRLEVFGLCPQCSPET
jgi:Fur family ferric uptake transcriptional regulator